MADEQELKKNTASEVHVKRFQEKKSGNSKHGRTMHFSMCLHPIQLWLKISVDVFSENKMMDHVLRKKLPP